MIKFSKGVGKMGRTSGTKNIMRTPEEKERIVKRYFNGESPQKLSKEIGASRRLIYSWINKYEEKGIEGLKSKTGKHNNFNTGLYLRKPKNKIEQLELEIMRKDIEIARLKKGYIVKGGGDQKEYVTTFDKNIK